jgi:hypothetical protein
MKVSKNPDGECNPKLGEDNVLGIVLGIGFTFLSLAWTGWSFTAESRVQGRYVTEKYLKIESHVLDGCRVLQYSTCFLCHTEVAEVQFRCMKVIRMHPRKIA